MLDTKEAVGLLQGQRGEWIMGDGRKTEHFNWYFTSDLFQMENKTLTGCPCVTSGKT